MENKKRTIRQRRSPEERAEQFEVQIMLQIKKYIENGSKGDLDLSETPIKSIPKELTYVEGDLILQGCKSLTSLPDNLKVDGSLNLDGCKNLTSLPDNLQVDGGLSLYGCESLTSLPDTLHVKGNVYVDKIFNINPYRKEVLFIRAFNGEQVLIIEGEVIATNL